MPTTQRRHWVKRNRRCLTEAADRDHTGTRPFAESLGTDPWTPSQRIGSHVSSPDLSPIRALVHQGCTLFGTRGGEQWASRHPKTQAGSSHTSQPMQAAYGIGRIMRFRRQEANVQGVPLCGAFPLSTIQQQGYATEKCKASSIRLRLYDTQQNRVETPCTLCVLCAWNHGWR